MATTPPADPLTRAALARQYGYALKVIYGNKELTALFERAVNGKKGQWTTKQFTAQLMNTKWWQNNAGPAREAWAAQQLGTKKDGTFTADWQDQLNQAGDAVDTFAAQMGAQLTPEERDTYIHRWLYEGWKTRPGLMADAMAGEIGASTGGVANGRLMGASGDLEETLRQTAAKNGLKLSNEYFIGAARSVASGLTTESDWIRDVRGQAASLWPAWSDKINAGADAYDLLSGYRTIMAETFEVPPESIDLSDPFLKQAVTGVDEKGNPKVMGLWDFQTQLRNDPRWMDTKQATDQMSSIGTDVLRLMGFM